jgi:putative ATP-dependent endonuclease of the OLD family
MLLKYIKVENFRGFEKLELELDETTVLIGENNCGKTSLLEAVRLCLSRSVGRKVAPFEDHDYHLPTVSSRPGDAGALKIALRFAETSNGDWPPELIQTLADAIALDAQGQVSNHAASHQRLRYIDQRLCFRLGVSRRK